MSLEMDKEIKGLIITKNVTKYTISNFYECEISLPESMQKAKRKTFSQMQLIYIQLIYSASPATNSWPAVSMKLHLHL